MGKDNYGISVLETEGSGEHGNLTCPCRGFLEQITCKWIISVAVGVQLLVFVLLAIAFHGKHNNDPWPLSDAKAVASFKLRRSVDDVKSDVENLKLNISSRIIFPGVKVDIWRVQKTKPKGWTEVIFGVLPDPSNKSLSFEDITKLRGTVVKLYLKEKNLSLVPNAFGKAYEFQVLDFYGGLTIVPERASKSLSRRCALFNFTLHNSLSHVNSQFKEFKTQLAHGLSLAHDENLITRLTNLEGSTVKAPVIVQASVFRAVDHHLTTPRLKQLAQHVIRNSSQNLGLNHSMFGNVREIRLSPYLQHSLGLPHAPSPAPSPMQGFVTTSWQTKPSDSLSQPTAAPASSPSLHLPELGRSSGPSVTVVEETNELSHKSVLPPTSDVAP